MQITLPAPAAEETPAAPDNPIVEYLNRGILSAATSAGASGRLVSWRFLANDPEDTTFRLYRDGERIHTSLPGAATSFLDSRGTAASNYRVDALSPSKNGGEVFCSQDRVIRANGFAREQDGGAFFDIPLNPPPRGVHGGTYHANDITVGDVDGDGQYELFIKWDPSNARDAAQDGITDNVFIECVTLEGQSLWRIDLGPNIRAGAHYTQMLVADFEMNGTASLIVKTADGTIDGQGNVIGNPTAIHRNANGRILTGDEFLTLFCGKTGANLHTIPYNPPIGQLAPWGNGRPPENRVNRFLGAVAYLDGQRPSAVMIRGYYTRMAAAAYDVVDGKLVERWVFDTGHNSSHPAFGQGNHNVMPAAVHEGSSRQSIFLGASAIRYDGELLWSSRRGHGDALHVGNFIPGRTQSNSIQVFSCFETSPFGIALFDGLTGQELWRQTASGDTGRCMAGNFLQGNPGSEFWGAGDLRDMTGQRIGNSPDGPSFAIWFDGRLERQLLNNTGGNEGDMRIDRVVRLANGNIDRERAFTVRAPARSINGTKANPNITADLFGDWREELIVRHGDGSALRVFVGVTESASRITTLMHDPQYRMQVAGQNVTYNQPPHPSFFLGTGQPLPPSPDVRVRGDVSEAPPERCEDCGDFPCYCPELCEDCGEAPCRCDERCDDCGEFDCDGHLPKTISAIRRESIIEACETCGVEKIWRNTWREEHTEGSSEYTILEHRRAAKRTVSGELIDCVCE